MVEIQVKQQQQKYNEKSMTKKLRGQNCAKCQVLKRSQYKFSYKKKRLSRRNPTDDKGKMQKENDNSQKLKMSVSTNTV